MGVHIPNFELPKTCFECPFMFARRYCCADLTLDLYQGDYDEVKGRVDGCPLVPVPDHGRLIDADALPEHKFAGIVGQKERCSYMVGWNTAIEAIQENAPTVIPVDREGA